MGSLKTAAALAGGHGDLLTPVNLPNAGQVDNLPRDAVVETLATVNRAGVQPVAGASDTCPGTKSMTDGSSGRLPETPGLAAAIAGNAIAASTTVHKFVCILVNLRTPYVQAGDCPARRAKRYDV